MLRDTSLQGLLKYYSNSKEKLEMVEKTKTAAEIKKIVEKVKSSFDASNVTSRGHTKYVRFSVNNINFAWKPGKGLAVEPAQYTKVQVDLLSSDFLKAYIENKKTIDALNKALTPESARTKSTTDNNLTF